MTARDIRTNFALFVDGRSYVGDATQVNAPKLERMTEEFRAGGMFGKIKLDMGQEPMDASFTLSKYDLPMLGLYGLAAGQTKSVTLREVLESTDGTVKPVIHTMRGFITAMDPGTSEAGKPGELNVEWSLRYYKLQHGQTVIHEIDLENSVHIINGVDVMAEKRAALGI